jgi:hypothetical protein
MRASSCARPAKSQALSRSKRGKGRLARARSWHLHQPGNCTNQVDSRGNDQMLKMRFRHSDVAASAQITEAYRLGKHTFYARAPGIASLKLAGLLPLSGFLQRLVVLAMAQCQFATCCFGMSALTTHRTATTTRLSKRYMDNRLAMPIACRFPFAAGMSLRTAHLLLFPIDRKAVVSNAPSARACQLPSRGNGPSSVR